MNSKVKPSSWAISRYVVNRIPSSLETRCDWCTSASHCFSAVLVWRNISWHASFTKKQGGHILTWFRFSGQSGQTGQTSLINRSDRSGKIWQIINWTTPLHRSRRGDWNTYMERPIWSPDEEVMPLRRSAHRSNRSDRSRDPSDRSRKPNPS